MFAVGLTGGIATGKSTILKLFNDIGIDTFCADQFSKEAVQPGSVALDEIITRYSPKILLANGHLNRHALKEIIFNDSIEKKWLEHLIHPVVRQNLYKAAKRSNSEYCILDIPLLNKEILKQYTFIQKVITIITNPKLQLARLIKRDGIEESLAQKIIKNQITDTHRLEISDFTINNTNQSLQSLKNKVLDIHQILLNESRKIS